MSDEGGRLVDNKLVDTGYSVRANDWTWVTEKLNELWNENIERSIESIRVQLIRTVFTYLV